MTKTTQSSSKTYTDISRNGQTMDIQTEEGQTKQTVERQIRTGLVYTPSHKTILKHNSRMTVKHTFGAQRKSRSRRQK